MTTLPPRQNRGASGASAQRGKRCSKLKGRAEVLSLETGAGNESRTRDLNLGKVALYQLSYSRK